MVDKVIVTKSKLTGLADTIRAKTGSTEKMSIDAMNSVVNNLSLGDESTLIGLIQRDLYSITIPDSVTTIGRCAFYEFSKLNSITIPDSVTRIEYGAFMRCFYLPNITIPDSVTYIGLYAFSQCERLTSIIIPNSVTYIGDWAFNGCNGLTSVTIPENVTSIEERVFNGCSRLTSIEIPNNVTSIGDYAFNECSSLTNVTIPKSVTNVGTQAFYGCSSLTNVYYQGTIEDWWNIQFSNSSSPMKYAEHFYMLNENNEYYEVTEIVIPDSVTSIGNYALRGFSSLTSVTIPDSVTSIGDYAFYECSSLTNVYYKGTITDWCNIKFSNNNSTPMCYAEHFYMLNENNEYYEVTEIVIPDSVTSIGNYTFSYCDSLTSIEIPNSVTSIGGYAFTNCRSLIKIDFSTHTTVPTLSDLAPFINVASGCQCIVPDALYDEWIVADVWKDVTTLTYVKASEVPN